MKKLLAVALSLMLVLTSAAALADTLTMVTNASFPPYEFIGDNGEVTGIDAEIAAAIAAKLGYDLKIVDMEFESLIPAVTSGKADFTMAGMTVTPEREQLVAFSDSYATGVQVIIVGEDSPITSADDLFVKDAGHTVGVQMATTGFIYASDEEADGKCVVSAYPNGNEAVMALANGKIDCVIIDSEPAKAYVAVTPGLKILETAYTVEDYAAAFAKNSELVASFNAAMAELIEDGTIPAIIAKYIPSEE